MLSALIGSVSFAGSAIAFAKLRELIGGRPITTRPADRQHGAPGRARRARPGDRLRAQKLWLLVVLILGALAFGILFVLPIGGADMPVVISLLNAFTGVAAAATGFVLHQNVLIVSGMLVGASGTLLTLMMARAMGRKVSNVFFGAFGKLQTSEEGGVAADGGTVRSTSGRTPASCLPTPTA